VSWLPPSRSAAPAFEEDWASPPEPAQHQRAAFNALRAALRRSRRRTAGLLVTSYLGYAAMSVLAPAVIAHRVAGALTVGLLIGCAEIAIVVLVAFRYPTEMGRRVDPLADAVRAAALDRAVEGGAHR
jgi:uncharacterized membrane protein (DUF485 family)